jgi:antitoxin HigA-1
MSVLAHDPVTPGEILQEEFLNPLGISKYRLAQATGLTATHIGQIVQGTRRITPDAGIRISRALGVNDRYWIDLQTNYDITLALIETASQFDLVPSLVGA